MSSQEAAEYVYHDLLTSRFHVTHYAGCAILFNKDTFYPSIDVAPIYLHDTRRDLPDQVMEGEQRWLMQGVLLTCLISSIEVFYSVVSTYQQHLRQEQRHRQEGHSHSSCHYDSQEVDLVAGVFFFFSMVLGGDVASETTTQCY